MYSSVNVTEKDITTQVYELNMIPVESPVTFVVPENYEWYTKRWTKQ